MLLGEIEQINFGARANYLPLLFTSPFIIFSTWLAWHEITRLINSEANASFEILLVMPLLMIFITFCVSYTLLAKGLKFTEAGIYRRTVFPPRFITWSSIEAARITYFRQNVVLELRVNRWRWIIIPLLDFRYNALLLSEIRKRLSFEFVVSERDLAMLNRTDSN